LASESTPTAGVVQSVAPTAAATVAASEAPAFSDFELSGTGPAVEEFTIPEGIAAIASMTHDGEENFIVNTVDAQGEQVDGLVNEIGEYAGTVLINGGINADNDHPVAFEIEADGDWKIAVNPVADARPWDPTSNLAGEGDDVVLVSPPPSGLTTIELAYEGDSNFIVFAYTDDSFDLLASEIGDFTGEVLLPAGTVLLEISGHGGTWTATPT
jgi:hypothetical protein